MIENDGKPPFYLIFMLCMSYLSSVIIHIVKTKVDTSLAPTVLTFLMSMIIGFLLVNTNGFFGDKYEGVARFPPQHVMALHLSVKFTSVIYHMDYYIFKRYITPILIIAGLGFVMNLAFITFSYKIILHPYLTYQEALLCSLVMLPIWPDQIILLLKDLAKYNYLGTILECEALISIILILIIFQIGLGIQEQIISQWYQVVIIFTRYLVGGFAVGVVMGKLKCMLFYYLYNDVLSAMSVSIGVIFLTYYLAEFVLCVSGTLAIFCLMCIVVAERHRFSEELDLTFSCVWRALQQFFDIGVFAAYVIEAVIYLVDYIDSRTLYSTAMFFFYTNITRSMSFVVISVLLNKMTSFNLNARCGAVLAWSGVKGNLTLLMTFSLLYNRHTYIFANDLLCEVYIYTFLSLFINSSTTRLILKMIGLSEHSATRRINMNNCMKYIMEIREMTMNVLKTNRFLNDANWGVVRAQTLMKHPYKLKLSDDDNDDDDFMFNTNTVVCPDCLREVPFEISDKEFEDVVKEAKVKILKAKKVSLIKQYETGIINMACLQVLLHQLESMIESNLKSNRLNLKPYLTESAFLMFLYRVVETLEGASPTYIPKRNWNRFWFYLVHHFLYDYVLFGIILSYVITIILLKMRHDTIFALTIPFCLIFTLDVYLKIASCSRKNYWIGVNYYFHSLWNVWDFTMLILQILAAIFYSNKITIPLERNQMYYIIVILGMLRLLKFLQLLQPLLPKVLKLINRKIDYEITFGYDLASALLFCCEEIIDSLRHIIQFKLIRDRFLLELQDEKRWLMQQMQMVQKNRPWIAITVKTKQAIRTTLTTMEVTLKEMNTLGFVDTVENNIINKALFEKQKYLRHVRFVKPSSPKVIFNEVPWMSNEQSVIEFLYHHVQLVSWDVGEIIYKEGKQCKGIYIVVTGLLNLIYVPGDTDKTMSNGAIPIIDYLSTIHYDSPIDDHIMSGNSFGELAVLTGRPYDCTIVAESPSQAYFLRAGVVKEAMQLNSSPIYGLQSRMWKHATLNLAVAIMMDLPMYNAYSQEQIKFKLEHAFVPNLHCYKTLAITDMMDDVLLIEGAAADYDTGTIFIAPTMIPRTIHKLILSVGSYVTLDEQLEVRLMIVPLAECTLYELMEQTQALSELTSLVPSKCFDQFNPKKRTELIFSKKSEETFVYHDDLRVEVIEPHLKYKVSDLNVSDTPLLKTHKGTELKTLSEEELLQAHRAHTLDTLQSNVHVDNDKKNAADDNKH